MLLPLDKLEYFTHYETKEYLTSACFTQPTKKKKAHSLQFLTNCLLDVF